MAIQVHKNKQSTTAGAVKTPAPVDARDKSYGRENYGSNAFAGPSSIAPGAAVRSPLADDLASGDEALASVIAKGTGLADNVLNTQTRDLPPNNVPDHPHMRNANAGGAPMGKVPPKTGFVEGQPVRKPGA
jgi:hypothetical protein